MFEFITGLIAAIGSFGVAILMFLENVFPPIPSELIMPLAGFEAAKGTLSLWGVLVGGIAGSLAGAALWYWIGAQLGAERLRDFSRRHGRWLTLGPEDIDRAAGWFDRHGAMAVLVGRLIPTVRTFVSVPAGVAGMPFGRFLLYSLAGTAIWTTLLALAGYWLRSRYGLVAGWLDPVTTVIVIGLIGGYLYRVVTFRTKPQQGV